MAVKNYAQYLNNIPVMPDVASKVLNMADSKDSSFQSLEDLIKVDPGLTSRILRIANSAMYARQKEVTQLRTAITLLGLKTIKNLVILATGASLFAASKQTPFYHFFWRHSIITAFLARDLAIKTGKRGLADEAFVAGLLHNIGQVALYFSDRENYEKMLIEAGTTGQRISELEEGLYGVNHKTVGHSVLSAWNFPTVYADTAHEHGNNNITSEHKQVIILVSTADFLASNLSLLKDNPKDLNLLQPFLPFLGLSIAALAVIQGEYMGQLNQDKLFLECQDLFNLN